MARSWNINWIGKINVLLLMIFVRQVWTTTGKICITITNLSTIYLSIFYTYIYIDIVCLFGGCWHVTNSFLECLFFLAFFFFYISLKIRMWLYGLKIFFKNISHTCMYSLVVKRIWVVKFLVNIIKKKMEGILVGYIWCVM